MRMPHRLLASIAALSAAASCGAAELGPGPGRTLPLAANGKIELELVVAPGSPYVVEVTEQGVDARVLLADGGRSWRAFDGDILRLGHHRLAVAAAGPEHPRLTVAGARAGSPDGQVRIALSPVPPDDAGAAARFALDLLETDTAQRFYDQGLAQQPGSAEQARRLVAGRREAGPPRDLGRAYLLLDQTLMKQFRYDEGIAALEQSLPVFRALGDKSAEASALNDIGMHYWRKGDGRKAGAPLAQALEVASAAGDALLRALVKSNICNVELNRGGVAGSVACARTALAWSEATGDLVRIANSWNNLGGAYSLTGQPHEAIAAYEKSVELRERSGVPPGPAQSLANIGLEYQALGRFDEAERQFQRAEALCRRDGDDRQLAVVLRFRGQLLVLLGNYVEAGALLEQALALQRKLGEREQLVWTLSWVGEVQRLRDGAEAIPAALEEALSLAERDQNPSQIAQVLGRIARVHMDAGRVDAAQPLLDRATEEVVAAKLADVVVSGQLHLLSARASLLRGRSDEAQRLARLAWTELTGVGERIRAAEASAIEGDALALRTRYGAAVPAYRRGLAEVARARLQIADPELRARFFSTRRHLHEGHVAALAELALASGRSEDALRALEQSDRYRAQVLSELLANRGTRGAARANPELQALRERAASLSMSRWRLAETNAPAATRAAVARELSEATERLAQLTREGAAEPGAGEADIGRELSRVPGDVTLVEFLSTRQRGYAWVVSGGAVRLLRMPGEAALEPAVAQVQRVLSSTDPGLDWSAPLEALCDAVWRPLGVDEGDVRVALVPDGALERVPWAALRCPAEGSKRVALAERHELMLLPALRALGTAARDDRARTGVLAVVDPVYDRSDRRLGDAAEPGSTVAASDALVLRGRRLVRLAATHEEASLLTRLSGEGTVTVLDGFDATRAAVLEQLGKPARLIHFGTHGVVSGDDLAGSGLVLSLLDREARAHEGFLSAREVAMLDVPAELVVIAACESGSGAAVSGEGLQSLAYGFLAAGARTVVAASWPVADAPTSRLMAAFYRALLQQGTTPAAALRSAQRDLSRDAYWRHPRFWAGFSVMGSSSSLARPVDGS